MNKTVFASVCLAVLIALLPACGCGNNSDCKGGSCPVATQVDETKAIDTQNSAVEAAPMAAQVAPEAAAMPEASEVKE